MAEQNPDSAAASRAGAEQVAGSGADPAQPSPVQSDGAPPVQGLRARRLSMDVIFYLVGYAAITAAVLSFFGLW